MPDARSALLLPLSKRAAYGPHSRSTPNRGLTAQTIPIIENTPVGFSYKPNRSGEKLPASISLRAGLRYLPRRASNIIRPCGIRQRENISPAW
jgi:hypothetical protein